MAGWSAIIPALANLVALVLKALGLGAVYKMGKDRERLKAKEQEAADRQAQQDALAVAGDPDSPAELAGRVRDKF